MKQRFLQIIRDPLWQFVSIIVSLIVTGVVYWLQQPYKELSYDIISSTPLFSIMEEAQGKVEVLFDGDPVTDAYLLIIKLHNSGNKAIISSDYESPIQLNFNEEVSILSAEVIDDTEYSITTTLQVVQNRIKLKPILINPKESVTIKVIASNYKELNITARITNINKIEYKSTSRERGKIWLIFTTTIMLVSYSISFFRINSRRNKPTKREMIVDTIIILPLLFGLFVLFFG
jgi:hypothetical protein